MYRSTLCVLFTLFIYGNCNEKCNGVHLLDDLGCEPVNKEGTECPVEYKCGDFSRKSDACNFKLKSYPIYEKVDDDLIYPSCNINCFCNNSTEKAEFTCAILDCPEWLGSPLGIDCYRKYELNKCCSVGQICPPFDEEAKCEVDGETFKEGQKFYPKDTCLSCVCKKGFKGEFSEEFCRKQVCAVELRHAEELGENCAPVYYSKKYCCPDNWICANPSDKIKIVNSKADSGSPLTCKFGQKSLKLGEGLERKIDHWGKERNVKCECERPPFLTCHEVDSQ